MSRAAFHWEKTEQRKLAANINQWKLMSDRFYRSSECIFEEQMKDDAALLKWHAAGSRDDHQHEPTLYHPYLLTIAYCLENILKGCRIAANPELIGPNEIDKKLLTHSLHKHALEIPLEWSEDELHILEGLSKCIYWLAKYPLPIKGTDEIGGWGMSHVMLRESFIGIYEKLSEYLRTFPALKAHLHYYKVIKR